MKTTVLEFIFKKIAGLKACYIIKERLQYRCFPVNIAKLFKNTHFAEHLPTAASEPLKNSAYEKRHMRGTKLENPMFSP